MDSQKLLHLRMLAAARQLAAQKPTPARRARLAEVIAYGVARGWNDTEGKVI
jgi:hypothetical protein